MTPYKKNLLELERLGLSERNIVRNFPPALGNVYRAVGMETTIKFLSKFGGLQIYLPEHVTSKSTLGGELGVEAAEKVANALGPRSTHVNIPHFPSDKLLQRLRFIRMLECEVSLNAAVRAVGISRRTGFTWKDCFFDA